MFRVDMEWNPALEEIEPIKLTAKTVTFLHPRYNSSSREFLNNTSKYKWFGDYAAARACLVEHCDSQIGKALKQISKYEAIKDLIPERGDLKAQRENDK